MIRAGRKDIQLMYRASRGVANDRKDFIEMDALPESLAEIEQYLIGVRPTDPLPSSSNRWRNGQNGARK
jgi:hypothetical protein